MHSLAVRYTLYCRRWTPIVALTLTYDRSTDVLAAEGGRPAQAEGVGSVPAQGQAHRVVAVRPEKD